MAQKTVINASGEEVVAYFDGQNISFKHGQKKVFEDGIADEIVRETAGLEIEGEEKIKEAPAEAVEVKEEAPVKAPAKRGRPKKK